MLLKRSLLAMSLAAVLGLSSAPLLAKKAEAPVASAANIQVDIPYETFKLKNGLTVVVHEDRKAPIVAVNIWYHVGAKNEPLGKSGFAHLFEHLMFQGSENFEGEFFDPFEKVGVTDQNGTTNSDRTNYFQNVPTTALDTALWMESDRMGHFLGAVTQKVLDEQRGVVQNEKRQGENQPYGLMWARLVANSFPQGHPYHHTTIGSMSDLNAANLEDVKNWFRTWYGPNNAVLVLAGDIDVKTAKEKVTQYFGDIPASPILAQPKPDIAKRSASTREVLKDRVPQTRVLKSWNVPGMGNDAVDKLDVLATVLGGSKSSWLDRELVHKQKLVDRVSVFNATSELAGMFVVYADIKAGVPVEKVEKEIDAILAKFMKEGPSEEELARAKTSALAGFVRGIERIGGFGGKADVLAACQTYLNNPGCFKKGLELTQETTQADLKKLANEWLTEGDFTLVIEPGEKAASESPDIIAYEKAEDARGAAARANMKPTALPKPDGKYSTVKTNVDRSKGVPMPDSFPDLSFPKLQRSKLDNGIEVVLAERHEIPVVQISSLFDGAGYTADQGRTLGTASFTMSMMDEGAAGLSSLAFADKAESLGANMGAGAGLDSGSAYLSALKSNLAPSIALFADMVQNPDFTAAELNRVRSTWIANIKQEKAQPRGMATRVLPPLLYGEGHPYAVPLSGTGSETSIAGLNRKDLVSFHQAYVRPENTTMVVVGDTTMKEIVPLLNKYFGQWKPEGKAGAVAKVGDVSLPESASMYLIDQPGAQQATIFVGQLVDSTKDPKSLDFDIANTVLGGQFSARLNMNLREDKHWAYGSYSYSMNAEGQRPWIAFAPVQIDKTVESLNELSKEITQYADGSKPATADEISKVKATRIRKLPGSFETAASVRGQIASNIRYGRAEDHVVQEKKRIENMSAEAIHTAAKNLKPAQLTWVVVGDLSKIKTPIQNNFGKQMSIKVMDADGKVIK